MILILEVIVIVFAGLLHESNGFHLTKPLAIGKNFHVTFSPQNSLVCPVRNLNRFMCEDKNTNYAFRGAKFVQILRSLIPIRRSRRAISVISTIIFCFIFSAKNVFAANVPVIKGWDLYGRVPYDDWLFSTWALTSKNLLKQSLTEIVNVNYFSNIQ